MSEKLQKVLARAGLASRREIERWIARGRVSIDGTRAKLGDRVEPRQVIRVDGRVVPREKTPSGRRVLAYYKPEGEVCTRSDPRGRPTVFDHLPQLDRGRWVVVGRLDLNTAGLLLFTTDGELANRLMHPAQEIEREYAVRVSAKVPPDILRKLKTGVNLEDGPAHFDAIHDAGTKGVDRWYQVTLSEGRKREVRRLWEVVGVKVGRLIRIRYGPVSLPRGLRAGRWAELGRPAVADLVAAAGLKPEPPQRTSVRPDRKAHHRVVKPHGTR
ncbi:MAG: 23S rRNA pseudouridine(2605) synthase RluB [Candidatus Methylomirabilales bacterium]